MEREHRLHGLQRARRRRADGQVSLPLPPTPTLTLTLTGGVLTGKYLEVPAATDDPNRVRSMASSLKPRGRMDEAGWGRTLYRYRSGPADEATRT